MFIRGMTRKVVSRKFNQKGTTTVTIQNSVSGKKTLTISVVGEIVAHLENYSLFLLLDSHHILILTFNEFSDLMYI